MTENSNAKEVAKFLADVVNRGDVVLADKKVELREILESFVLLIGVNTIIPKIVPGAEEFANGDVDSRADVVKHFNESLVLRSAQTEAELEAGFAFLAQGYAFFKTFKKSEAAQA